MRVTTTTLASASLLLGQASAALPPIIMKVSTTLKQPVLP